jgi:hypothetical protein
VTPGRRRHSKIARELPPELVDALNAKLVEGHTYEEIVDWLKGMGHTVSRSGVGRYAKDFLTRLEKLKNCRDQAKAIIDDATDQPQTAMAEAASQIAFQLIMEALLEAGDKGAAGLDKRITEAMKALAQLERSGVDREKLKQQVREKAKKVAEDVEKRAAAAGLDPEVVKYIREQIYGLAS